MNGPDVFVDGPGVTVNSPVLTVTGATGVVVERLVGRRPLPLRDVLAGV